MASNFSNYFFKAYTDKPHFDEFVFGFNGTSGSQRMDSAKQAVATIEFVSGLYAKTGSDGKGFSITGSIYGGSTQLSEIKIEVDASYTTGDIYVSSSQEVWLRLKSGSPFLLSRSELIEYLAETINYHRLSPAPNSGPPVIASRSGSFLVLTQEFPGPAGNECDAQNLGATPLPSVTFETFEGGDGVGGGPYSINWSPTTGSAVSNGTRIVDSYVLSPVRHGNVSDIIYSPPQHFVYDSKASYAIFRNISATDTVSSNTDSHSRIFTRYTDEFVSEGYSLEIDPMFTSLS